MTMRSNWMVRLKWIVCIGNLLTSRLLLFIFFFSSFCRFDRFTMPVCHFVHCWLMLHELKICIDNWFCHLISVFWSNNRKRRARQIDGTPCGKLTILGPWNFFNCFDLNKFNWFHTHEKKTTNWNFIGQSISKLVFCVQFFFYVWSACTISCFVFYAKHLFDNHHNKSTQPSNLLTFCRWIFGSRLLNLHCFGAPFSRLDWLARAQQQNLFKSIN